MTPERLSKIMNLIYLKYKGKELSPLIVRGLYNDLSAIIKGLHKSEHFLNVYIDTQSKVILCKDEEALTYIGVLPYLDNRLMKDDSEYFVYLFIEDNAYIQCAIKFKDLYKYTKESVGFDVDVYPIKPLGIYHSSSNSFKRWR